MMLKYFVYACILSNVCLAKYDKGDDDVYNSVFVTFPDDPCDDEKIEMPDFSDRRRSISETKCFEYVWRMRYEQGKDVRMTQCEKKETDRTPILGGSDVSDGEYPHMGALGWKAKVGTWIFKCGSSLISEKFALTAAHCSCVASTDKTVTDLEPKIVRLGCSNIMDVDRGEPAYDVNIRRFISHHRYNPPRQYYDIALVELEQEVSFRWQVHPACLWTKFKNPVGGTVTGWGVVETASLTTSPELQKADIRIVEADHCDDMLQMKRNGRKWWGIVWHQLCAGDSAGRIDTCRGDSGGPLQTLIPLRHSSPFLRWKLHQIVGVTSFGFGCARPNTPSIYTRVASFIGWIESIVWPSNRTIENRMLFYS
ncbi:serine protease Hayan-like [Pararge aegeria]|uniref:serine protease Hayan-like n=1 Tax=Pararge aegeria TaxID=116150 RepID=UPI0019D11E3B|nr:serine protease Hayan-like [Pararge aegeria]